MCWWGYPACVLIVVVVTSVRADCCCCNQRACWLLLWPACVLIVVVVTYLQVSWRRSGRWRPTSARTWSWRGGRWRAWNRRPRWWSFSPRAWKLKSVVGLNIRIFGTSCQNPCPWFSFHFCIIYILKAIIFTVWTLCRRNPGDDWSTLKYIWFFCFTFLSLQSQLLKECTWSQVYLWVDWNNINLTAFLLLQIVKLICLPQL